MVTILLRTISSILYAGGLVMTGIGGWYDYQETLSMPHGPFGMSILLLGIIIAGLGSLFLILQLWYKIWKYENPKVQLEVYPNLDVGMEMTLVVHNKSNVSAKFSAVMTCLVAYDDFMPHVQWGGLQNVSMCWESSGKASEDIQGGEHKILKLCSPQKKGENAGTSHYMHFYKAELDTIKPVQCAHWSEGSAVPKVNVDILLSSNMLIKGQRSWRFQVYIFSDIMLGIRSITSGRKSLIRKVLRPNEFKECIPE